MDRMMDPLHTPFCKLVGVRWPIVQTGMGWVSGARLTAATSAAGGLGILAAATLSLSELDAAIGRIRNRTDKPFGVNLRPDRDDFQQRVALLIQAQVPVASFARAPGPKPIAQLKEAGIVTIPTVGAKRHAEKVTAWGVDALIAQGGEGGGHTGPVPTSLLLPAVCAATPLPVLGAGGFHSGQGLIAALAYGAAGVAMGTRFLLTQESRVPDAVKLRYLQASVKDTVVTTAVDGAPQRVLRTDLVRTLETAGPLSRIWRSLRTALSLKHLTGATLRGMFTEARGLKAHGNLSWAQVLMAANAPMLTRAALVQGNLEAGILPTGQVVGVIEELPTVAQVLEQIIAEARATLEALGIADPSADAKTALR
jgi:NAD(P)H-dependent flavin oxidoreductase YrpB (nitropropane dioxygenase family)